MSAFLEGKEAFISGKSLSDNPYTDGFTKLGNVRLTEEGIDWENGFYSSVPARIANDAEMLAAAKIDISRFRRKSNRHYQN